MLIPNLIVVAACLGIPSVLATEASSPEPKSINLATTDPPPLKDLVHIMEVNWAGQIGDCICYHRREHVAFNGKPLSWEEATSQYREVCLFLLLGYRQPPEGLAAMDNSPPYQFGHAVSHCFCDEQDKSVPATGTMDPNKLVRNRGYTQDRLLDPKEKEMQEQCQERVYQEVLESVAAAKAQEGRRQPGTAQTEKNNDSLKAISINPGAMYKSAKGVMGNAFSSVRGINPAAIVRAGTRAPGFAKLAGGFPGGKIPIMP